MFNAVIVIILVAGIFTLLGLVFYYKQRYKELLSQKKSSEVRLGQIAEHLIPFLRQFKYDPKKAHFIGMPIDYIVFDTDKIVFLEIKTGSAGLNSTQRRIKQLILEGKVVWDELRLSPNKVTQEERETVMELLKNSGITLKV
jgi:predicted Holliday junction resolvase-like endonuclease